MGAVIPAKILGLEGQVIKDVVFNEERGRVRVICARDRRRRPVDHWTKRRGAVNRLLRRTVRDVPIGGWPCEIEIEYAETYVCHGHARVEALSFVAPKTRVTRRYARLIAGMARHMPLSAVARHTGLSWDAVKAIECAHLAETLSMPRPQTLAGIRYLGVDEVARAKGQSYFTLVYDLSPGRHYGRILWIKEGREAAVLLEFLDALTQECAAGIAAIALDMGPAYIAAVRASLPNVAIVFDRFHVMQMFNKVIRDCRRAEFKAAKTLGDLTGQQTIKGSLWLLLSNRTTLKETDQERLNQLLAQNQPLATLYALKEQLQRLWQPGSAVADMATRLDDWCGMARAAKIAGLAKFVKTLQSHRTGICAYADHPITTSRLEAGNVSIALLRRRARGFRDMTYFKLKIFQLNTEDTPSFLYQRIPSACSTTVGNP
ncbi:MAG: ISL3 family transposase [Candidatus Nitricoxidivorans perseverans]|uniref:ISL3 family transposase n=1 Tax=Candidatus Nitricoxidivorans perseverans TaxID=2975601 RepID=A0AA49FLB0_9PROT|nr:MAG: ISL3 family transposase [Candidatus Nitricoxidivorans perseverans]